MKKEDQIITRREALRRILLGTGGLLFTPSLLGFGHELMGKSIPDGGVVPDARDDFFIRRIAEVFQGKTADPVTVAEAVSSDRSYRMYSLVHTGHPVLNGSVRLRRDSSGEGLRVELTRKGSQGHHQYVTIDQRIDDSLLCSPVEWTYDARLAEGADKEPLHGRVVAGKGVRRGRVVTLREGNQKRVYTLAHPLFTLNWNLMDAVCRLPRDGGALVFDTVDEYDIYGGSKRLSLYKPAEIEYDGVNHKLISYVLTGTGTLPVFYWLDEQGTLLFVNSGMEVYVLD